MKMVIRSLVVILWTTSVLVLYTPASVSRGDAGTIKGTIRAVAAGANSATIEGAEITLVNKATPDKPLKTRSNATGEFIFEDLPAGSYTLTISSGGLTTVTKTINLESGAMLIADIDMSATVSESVTVRSEEGLLSMSDTTTSNVVLSRTIKEQPLRTDNYQNAISLTPGAVRDGFGNDYIKGTRAGQSGYTVNGADVTDPVSGKLAFDIPLEAAQTVQIEENPYSAEYGRFTGGVTNLQTKGGGEKFSFGMARFFPAFHNVFSSKVDSFRPRVTMSGPIVHKKLYFLQSFEYRYTRYYVPSLAPPNDNTTLEGVNSFTQLDLNINKSNVLKFNAAFFPQRVRNFGLDTFNPSPTTPDYRHRGMLISLSEQAVFENTSFLASEVSFKTFDVDAYSKGSLPFTIKPEVNSGSFFADSRRKSKRLQWQETYYFRPLIASGEHDLKAGIEFDHTKVTGQLRYNSIFIRRANNTLAQRIDFTPATPIDTNYSEAAAFFQDKWKVNRKLTFDLGVRFDHDGVTGSNNFAPRFAFMYAPGKDRRTVIRGGAGIFYDRSLSAADFFDRAPMDRSRRYRSGSSPISPQTALQFLTARAVLTTRS